MPGMYIVFIKLNNFYSIFFTNKTMILFIHLVSFQVCKQGLCLSTHLSSDFEIKIYNLYLHSVNIDWNFLELIQHLSKRRLRSINDEERKEFVFTTDRYTVCCYD